MDMVDEDRARKAAMIEEFFRLSSAKDFEGFLALCTDDIHMSIPYQLPGFPDHADGKDEIRATRTAVDRYERYAMWASKIEPMLDPDRFLVESKGDMVVRATGRPYRNDYVNVFRFRDGKIAEWVSYHDPLRQMVAFGLTELPVPSVTSG
ncbi:nuclear transport factor 2 family protein [Nocardia sp. XZ_19_369]|uniref:nuclear transport factor 2 family protein n=1 Tax=Nocardia sp. XZ_19_369 TaxID=2769487 RepID=UPI00188DE7E4|nr:nuclear transport factor 2 family protein [Nocardia sp. XZ_19_369]